MYATYDYILHRDIESRHELTEAASIAEYFQEVGVKIGNNLFVGLDRVSSAELHKLDLLHNIYLGLLKHMIEWVEGVVKR